MNRTPTTRRTALTIGASSLAACSLAISLAAGIGHANAASGNGHAQSRAFLRFHNHPLYRSNGTLNVSVANDDDGDTTDSNPNLSALCQSYLGGPNPYANPAPNVDMIVGDATVTVGSQKGCSTAQNETTIAVNPYNPNNLVAGANDYRFYNSREGRFDGSGIAYTSFDGGKTWKNVVLPHLTYQTGATGVLSDMDSAGDPAISFGPNNTVYYANLVFSRSNDGSGIVVSVSHDGGLTWGEPVVVHTDGVDANGNAVPTNYFNDKEWIGADPNSGRVYVTWTHFTYDANGNYVQSPIVVASSSDFGATWSRPRLVSDPSATTGLVPYDQGSIPQVGRHGELYVAYEGTSCQTLACDQATDHDAIVVAKSTDGGQTFVNTEVATDYDFPINPDVGRATLMGENFRINSFPQFAIDQVTGRLYVTWADNRNGQYNANGNSIKTNGDVFVVTSSNGTQWEQQYQIGTPADEVYPAIAAYNGRVAVTFYTRAFAQATDPNSINLDYAYATATGLGNLGHTAVTRITTQSENPDVQFVGIGAVTGHVLQGVFIGDYTGVAMGSDGIAHPTWTDFRGNPGVTLPNQDAYTQAIPVK